MHRARLRFAVLMDTAFSIYQSEIKVGIDRYLEEADLDAVYFGIGGLDLKKPLDCAKMSLLDIISKNEFDGIILIPSAKYDPVGKAFLKDKIASLGGLPCVTLGPSLFGEDSICLDNEQGTLAIMRHLVEDHGYRRFAYVSGPYANAESIIRLGAYRKALDKAGIPHGKESEYEGNFDSNSGYEAVSFFLEKAAINPEVIVCANDRMALGVWNALEKRGISVPFDVAVTGFDDTQLSRALSNQFTTVTQSFDRLGYLAALRLHAFARGKKPPKAETLPAEIRVRSSCGCVAFKKRGAEGDMTGSESDENRAIRDSIAAFIRNGAPPRGEEAFYRNWVEAIHRAFGEGRSLADLEDCLHAIRGEMKDTACASRAECVVTSLYALMLEQCGQKAFVDFWDERTHMADLRTLLERLKGAIAEGAPLSDASDLVDRIMAHCRVSEFYLSRFHDPRARESGAKVVFGRGQASGSWTPGPESWIPRGSGSLVANALSTGGNVYGYALVDSRTPYPAIFDFLRVFGSDIAGILENREQIAALRLVERELRERIDAMTRGETTGP
jgi:DNA-binding LacI/PurR family transcriptional regulator